MKNIHKDYEGTIKTVITSNRGITLYFEDGQTVAINLPVAEMLIFHINPMAKTTAAEPLFKTSEEEYDYASEVEIGMEGEWIVYEDKNGRKKKV